MSNALVFDTPVPVGESVTRYFQRKERKSLRVKRTQFFVFFSSVANSSVRLQSVDWIRIESTSDAETNNKSSKVKSNTSDVEVFELDKASTRHVPCKLQPHATIRIGVRFSPTSTNINSTSGNNNASFLVHHRALLCVAVGSSAKATAASAALSASGKRRRRVLRIQLIATSLVGPIVLKSAPAPAALAALPAAVPSSPAAAPIKRLFSK